MLIIINKKPYCDSSSFRTSINPKHTLTKSLLLGLTMALDPTFGSFTLLELVSL
jgi:hypothetical protein